MKLTYTITCIKCDKKLTSRGSFNHPRFQWLKCKKCGYSIELESVLK